MGQGGDYAYRLETNFSIYVEMERQLKERGWAAAKEGSQRCHVLMGDRFGIKYAQLLGKETIGARQLVNYFPKTHLLTLKSAMVRRLREGYGAGALPGWLPRSYILMKDRALCAPGDDDAAAAEAALPPWKRKGSKGAGSKDLQEAERDRAAFAALPDTAAATWILKPSSGCGGEGIALSASPAELLAKVDAGSDKAVYVAQEYLAAPLLLPGGRKFDVRCWVLLTSPYDVHLFTEGSLRTSSSKYSSDLADLPAHVTNHCLQAKTAGYGTYEAGNEMWYSEFDAFLAGAHPGRSLATDILPQVRAIVLETLGAVRPLLEPASDAQYAPFQLFGYDFLIDEDFKVWLLEINGSPASAERWKAPMVRDILRLTVDAAFPGEATREAPPAGTPRFELISREV